MATVASTVLRARRQVLGPRNSKAKVADAAVNSTHLREPPGAVAMMLIAIRATQETTLRSGLDPSGSI
jgi:hypothetical protein